MHYLYNILITFSLPFALLRLLWRSRKNPDYRKRLGERFTLTNANTKNTIWIHTVSVGEFLATRPLIEQLLADNEKLLITTTTPTGSAMVREKLGQRVAHQYLPFDASFLARRFLNTTQPRIAVFVETEIWANYLRELKKRNIPALLINARLSEKSFKGYQRLGKFAREAVENFTEVACQNELSYKRFQQLGANTTTLGNLKFDLHVPSDLAKKQTALKSKIGARNFILIASTHKGEDEIVLKQFKSSTENRLLVIAPRHPERSNEVLETAEKIGLKAECYNATNTLSTDIQVLIVDTLGQLLTFYSLADYAIIGGSFVPRGGHNPLEAALFATPCQIGDHHFNFESLIKAMINADAIQVVSASQLFHHQPNDELGRNAQRFIMENRGATQKYVQLITNHKKAET